MSEDKRTSAPTPFQERFEEVAGSRKTAELARLWGIPFQTLQNWRKAISQPTQKHLARLVEASGRPADWWLGGSVKSPNEPASSDNHAAPEIVRIPVIDAGASAGVGAVNEHAQEIGGVPFPRDWLRRLGGPGAKPERCQFIRARGDSMAPTIGDGALVLVNRDDKAVPLARSRKRAPDDDIFVFERDGETRIKRLARQPDASITVISDNMREHPPEVLPPGVDAGVHGRVIWWDNRL